jgi:hypothetical protein
LNLVTGFAKFWYDFIVGDDWAIAAAVALTLVILVLIAHRVAWWLLPIVVVLALGVSLWRATR